MFIPRRGGAHDPADPHPHLPQLRIRPAPAQIQQKGGPPSSSSAMSTTTKTEGEEEEKADGAYDHFAGSEVVYCEVVPSSPSSSASMLPALSATVLPDPAASAVADDFSGIPSGNLCHCNYGPSLCELGDTCIKHHKAACFHAVQQEFNAELGAMELHHLFGCAPLEPGSDASHLTCNAWRHTHSSPRTIACCYEGLWCNRDLSVPEFPSSDHTPDPGSPFSSFALVPFGFLLFGFLIGLCLFLVFALPLRRFLFHKNGKMNKLVGDGADSSSASCPESGTLLKSSTDHSAMLTPSPYFGEDSGSGSGALTLVQRSIALDLQMMDTFARGRYGELRKALYRGTMVAVKIFYTTEEESWRNERDIYQSQMLNHQNILQYVAADILSNVESLTQMMLITDFHPLGSLYDYLRSDSILRLDEALQLALSTISGLEHLHNPLRGTGGRRKPEIAHRDIKSKNVLVKRRGVCCVADFGLAVRYEDNEIIPKRVNIQVGTKRYMAPELLSGTLNVHNFDEFKCADMYSFALVLWETLNRVQPPDSISNVSASVIRSSPPAPAPFPPPHQAMTTPQAPARHQRILSRSSGSSGFASSGCSADRTFAAFANSLHHQHHNQHPQQIGAVQGRPLAAMMETDSVLDEEGAVKDEGHRDGTNGVRHQEQQQRAHALPFQGMVDTDPSYEQMRQVVCDQKLRPPIDLEWGNNPSLGAVFALLEECWSEGPRSRHTALKVKKELVALVEGQKKGAEEEERRISRPNPRASPVATVAAGTAMPPSSCSSD